MRLIFTQNLRTN